MRVMSVPQAPEVIDGELAAVLAAYAYGRVTGQSVSVFYTDSRDCGVNLRRYVEAGRHARKGTLLASLTAPFTDAELMALQVRWVYRGLTRAHRLADTAARHMSLYHPIPSSTFSGCCMSWECCTRHDRAHADLPGPAPVPGLMVRQRAVEGRQAAPARNHQYMNAVPPLPHAEYRRARAT